MRPSQVREYYKTGYNFHQETGMSANTFYGWLKKGFVPVAAQSRIEKLTKGKLKASFHEEPEEVKKKRLLHECFKCGYISNVSEQHAETGCIQCNL